MRFLAMLLALFAAAPALAAPVAGPALYLSEGDARTILARRSDPIVGQALAALQADADAAARRGPQAPTPYSGCDVRQYLPSFSYEYGGAATRAANLADFVYLHTIDRSFGSDASADAAASQVRAILLGWARGGFRKPDGSYRTAIGDFCDGAHPADGAGSRGVADALGLQIGRGVPPFAHAFDLMSRSGRLSPAEQQQVTVFIHALGAVVHAGSDARAADQNFDCNRYSNQTSVAISAMTAAARATGDERWRMGIMRGDPAAAAIGWPRQVGHAIYASAGPTLSCYRKQPGDTLWQPATAAAGEVADRYRQVPGQTFGYTSFTLTNMLEPLVIARVAGSPPDAALADGRQRIALALDYYAHFYAAAGPDRVVVDQALAGVPGGDAYLGKVVSSAGCGTPKGSDHELSPYAAMLIAGVDAPKGRALVSRILADKRCPAFSRLDPVLIGALAHLPPH